MADNPFEQGNNPFAEKTSPASGDSSVPQPGDPAAPVGGGVPMTTRPRQIPGGESNVPQPHVDAGAPPMQAAASYIAQHNPHLSEEQVEYLALRVVADFNNDPLSYQMTYLNPRQWPKGKPQKPSGPRSNNVHDLPMKGDEDDETDDRHPDEDQYEQPEHKPQMLEPDEDNHDLNNPRNVWSPLHPKHPDGLSSRGLNGAEIGDLNDPENPQSPLHPNHERSEQYASAKANFGPSRGQTPWDNGDERATEVQTDQPRTSSVLDFYRYAFIGSDASSDSLVL